MHRRFLFLSLLPSLCTAAYAQDSVRSSLFEDHAPLTLRLETDLRALFRDRGNEKKDHPAVLRYGAPPDTGAIAVKLRTRGLFRLRHCTFPPIRIDLPAHKVDGTPFAGQNKLKLVTHCQNDRSFERYPLREYAAYRVFNALTDTSYRVRLARITYVDSARADTITRYGILIEPDAQLARRVDTEILENDRVHDALTQPTYMTLVAVFEYMIGNTDWSVWGRHNIAILRDTTRHSLLPVPYDFDFSGAVSAPYATPPPQLAIRTVQERLYRGFCQPDSVLNGVLDRFRAAKDSIYASVRAVPDLPDRDLKNLLSYFDSFYGTIDNRGAVQREFVRACRRP